MLDKIKAFIKEMRLLSHFGRMFNQALFWVIISFFGFSLGFLVLISLFTFKKHDLKSLNTYTNALIISTGLSEDKLVEFDAYDGRKIKISAREIKGSSYADWLINRLKKNALLSLYISFILSVFIGIWLTIRNKEREKDKVLRGQKLATKKELIKQLKKNKEMSDLKLGDCPIIKDFETRHFFIHGSTGSGKSQCISQMLDYARKKGQKAIIFDEGGAFIEKFYNSSTDFILNPLDSRGVSWSLWHEFKEDSDFNSFAESLMPVKQDGQDPFWNYAARLMLSKTAHNFKDKKNPRMSEMLRWLLCGDLSLMEKFLIGTGAEIFTSDKIEKTALSVRAVLASALDSLKYIKEDGEPFSIKKWVTNEKEAGFLFISTTKETHATIRPLISLWLNTAIKSVLSLRENPDRRLWIILDELSVLNKLGDLEYVFSQGRKVGMCGVIGVQNYAQLATLYGIHQADSLVDLCNLRLFFRSTGKKVCDWVSAELGEYEVEELIEGLSFGANSMRDGVMLNRQTKVRRTVYPTDIIALRELQGFLALGYDYPVSKTNIPFIRRDSGHINFEQRRFKESDKALFDLVNQRKREVSENINGEYKEIYEHPIDKVNNKLTGTREKEQQRKQDLFDEIERSMQQKEDLEGLDDKAIDESRF